MRKFTVRAPNGRSVNIKCDLGRFEFMHEEVLTQGSPHDVVKLAGIFPTIFIEKVEAAASTVDAPLSHQSDTDPKFVVTEGQPVATGTDAVAGKDIASMTDEEIAAEAARIAQEARGSLSDAGILNSAQSIRSEEKADELDPEKVAAKLMSIGAAKTTAAQPTLLNDDESAVEVLVESAVETIAKKDESPPIPVKEKKQEKPVKKEEKKTAAPVAKGKIKKK